MLKEVKKKLNQYGYQASFLPYHKKKDINFYRNKKDAVSGDRYLTIRTNDGHVIGRLYNITNGHKKLHADDINSIVNFFTLYQITNSGKVAAALKKILPSEKK
ncbi:MAG TPA: hypothetical protein VKS21_05615 [Spirochaetota bacterium]|nr:hypothetical protein [Spirochaetota bacterium]